MFYFTFILLVQWTHGAQEISTNATVSEQSEITMMVLNLANYDDWGDWQNRREIIGKFILLNEVDVMYFSEVRFDKSEPSTGKSYMNMAEQIVEYLQNNGVHCKIHTDPAMYYERGSSESISPTEDFETLWEGLTTITCNKDVKMITTEEMYLNDDVAGGSDQNERIAQYTHFEFFGKVFGSINSHWSNDANDRLSNAEETLTRLAEWKDATAQPNILVGDLNSEMECPFAPPDSALMALKNAGWIDVWRTKYPDIKKDPGYTLYNAREKRVDYVWANACFYSAIRSVGIVGKREHDDPDDWWSDHFGLIISVAPDLFQTHDCTYSAAVANESEAIGATSKTNDVIEADLQVHNPATVPVVKENKTIKSTLLISTRYNSENQG